MLPLLAASAAKVTSTTAETAGAGVEGEGGVQGFFAFAMEVEKKGGAARGGRVASVYKPMLLKADVKNW